MLGATGPIGSALSVALARAGASLALHGGSDGEALDALARSCGGTPLAPLRARLRDFRSALDAVEFLRELPAPDILCCAFGPFHRAPLAGHAAEDWSRMAELNLALPGALVSALLPGMLERGYGRFLFFGASAGEPPRGARTNAAYAAAKAGLAVLARSVAMDAQGRDIACTVICPGFVDSPGLNPAFREGMRERAPGGRLQDPGEIAEMAVWALSRPHALLSGAVIRADGGLCL